MQRVNLLSKAHAETIELGSMEGEGGREGEGSREGKEECVGVARRPIFVQEMGAMQDFYVWSKDSRTVELGMLYAKSASLKGKYEISQVEL